MPPIIINPINGDLTFAGGTNGSTTAASSLNLTVTKTSNYTAVSGQRIPCDTSSNSFTITTPLNGRFGVLDKIGTSSSNGFGINPLTIQPSGSNTIMGDESLILDVGALSVEFELLGTDWRIISSTNLANNSSGLTNPISAVFQSIFIAQYIEGGTTILDCSTSNTFSLTASGTSTTLSLINVPAAGNRYSFELHLTWSSGSITWPSSLNKGDPVPTTTGNYVISGITTDGGTSFKTIVLAE